MSSCCGNHGKVWNLAGGNWCCDFCGKGLTKEELKKLRENNQK